MDLEPVEMSDIEDGSILKELFAEAAEKHPKRIINETTSELLDYYLRVMRKYEGKTKAKCQDAGEVWYFSKYQGPPDEDPDDPARMARQNSMNAALIETIRSALYDTPTHAGVFVEFVKKGSKNNPFHTGPLWEGHGAEDEDEDEASPAARRRKDPTGASTALAAVGNANADALKTMARTASTMAARSDQRNYESGIEVGTARATLHILQFYKGRVVELEDLQTSQTWASAFEHVGTSYADAIGKMGDRDDLPEVIKAAGDAFKPLIDLAGEALRVYAAKQAVAAMNAANNKPAPSASNASSASSAPSADAPPKAPPTPEEKKARLLALLKAGMDNGAITPEDLAGIGATK